MSEEEPANAPSCVLTAAFWGRPSDDLPGVDRRPIRGSPEGFHKRPGGLQGTPSSLHKTLGGLLWWQKDLKMFIVLPRTLVGLLGTPEGTSSWSGPRTSKGHRMAYRGLPVAFAKRYRCPSFVARRYQDVHWLSQDTGPFYGNLQRTLDGLLGTPEGTPSKEHRRAFIRRRMAYKGRPAAFIRRSVAFVGRKKISGCSLAVRGHWTVLLKRPGTFTGPSSAVWGRPVAHNSASSSHGDLKLQFLGGAPTISR